MPESIQAVADDVAGASEAARAAADEEADTVETAVGERLPLCCTSHLALAGVSIGMDRGRQQNDRTLADGQARTKASLRALLRELFDLPVSPSLSAGWLHYMHHVPYRFQ